MLGEVVHEPPVEVFVHVAETVALLRKHEHVETLAGAYESLDHAHRIARMDIVVYIAMNEEEMSLEILRDLRIGSDLVDECGVALLGNLFLDSVMSLAPPAVVDIVVMVAGA